MPLRRRTDTEHRSVRLAGDNGKLRTCPPQSASGGAGGFLRSRLVTTGGAGDLRRSLLVTSANASASWSSDEGSSVFSALVLFCCSNVAAASMLAC